jgi:hypothetical protein
MIGANENWKPVVGFEGHYEVSDHGRVRRACAGKGTRIGRVLKTPPDTDGYPRVRLSRNGIQLDINVHILVAAAFIGPCPEGKEVNHKNLNRANNRAGNLEYSTHQENIQHSYAYRKRAA